MSRNKGQGGQHPPLERRYGFFRCPSCNGYWESAQVYCIEDTDTAPYEQECKNCKTACLPYKVEDLKCPKCGVSAKECQGTCDDDDDDYSEADDFFDSDDEEHVDRKSPTARTCVLSVELACHVYKNLLNSASLQLEDCALQ